MGCRGCGFLEEVIVWCILFDEWGGDLVGEGVRVDSSGVSKLSFVSRCSRFCLCFGSIEMVPSIKVYP